jgi:hypothetical protein
MSSNAISLAFQPPLPSQLRRKHPIYYIHELAHGYFYMSLDMPSAAGMARRLSGTVQPLATDLAIIAYIEQTRTLIHCTKSARLCFNGISKDNISVLTIV